MLYIALYPATAGSLQRTKFRCGTFINSVSTGHSISLATILLFSSGSDIYITHASENVAEADRLSVRPQADPQCKAVSSKRPCPDLIMYDCILMMYTNNYVIIQGIMYLFVIL